MAHRASRLDRHRPGHPAPSRPLSSPADRWRRAMSAPPPRRKSEWALLMPYLTDWRLVSFVCIVGLILLSLEG
jgi:hypothetical protein